MVLADVKLVKKWYLSIGAGRSSCSKVNLRYSASGFSDF